MKLSYFIQSAVVTVCTLAALPLAHGGAVQQTEGEIHMVADLDGDGRPDLVVLDRASGGYRAAYQLAEGVWTWYPARATGIGEVSGAAVGRFFDLSKDALAVTSPLANRVHIVRAYTPGGLPIVDAVYPAGIGPDQVAAPDVGGNGNTAHDDLWTSSIENGSPTPVRISSTRHDGNSFAAISDFGLSRRPKQAQAVVIKEEGIRHIIHIGTLEGQSDLLTVASFASGSAVVVANTVVPEDSYWTSGLLGAGSLHHVLVWQRGSSSFRSIGVTENQPAVFGLATHEIFDVAMPVGQLIIVRSDAGPRLLVIDEAGTGARVFSFDGETPPVLIQDIAPAPGAMLTGAAGLPGTGFHIFEGTEGSGITTTSTPYTAAGGSFTPSAPTQLPVLLPATLRANAFAFSTEPFVDPSAQLLGRYNAPDWTSNPLLQGGQLTVSRETMGNSSQGLGDPAPTVIGTVPMGTAFALTNQYSREISLHSYAAGDGATRASVDIFPVPGIKTRAFRLSFNAQPAIAPVYYRLNEGPWVQWDGNEVLVGEDTTVRYYAEDPLSQLPSAIRVAMYSFEVASHELDSDGDGVPDFVEKEFGIDPLMGVDSDGDGYSDLNEILVDTKPNDKEDAPNPNQRLEENIAFRLRVAPRPLDGSSDTRTGAALGARLDVFGLDGSSIAGGAAEELNQPGLEGPGLGVEAVVADPRMGFVTVMTEPVFAVTTADPDKDRGREIAGLFPIPEGSLPPINYVPGNGSQAEEAAAWVAAALLARNSAVRPSVSGNWTELDTLVAFVLERKLEQIFLERGLTGLEAGKLSLFGGRTGDAGRFVPSAEDYAALRLQLSESLPGYEIPQLFDVISSAVVNSPDFSGLRDTATAIYRVSSANSNAAEPGTYLPPFDVLRAFVRGAPLPEPYLSEVGITAQVLANAQGNVLNLLTGLPNRPVESYMLIVEETSFDAPCSTLTLLGLDMPVNLFAAPGIPFAATDGFNLIPGTKLLVTGYTDVVDDDCDGADMEVIDVLVLEFPPPDSPDLDQDLLPDAWEEAFLLGDGDPYADDDDDGASNLQELLDGTDPLDPFSKALEFADLSPPDITVLADPQGITLTWTFPAFYADQVFWSVETSDNFINWVAAPNPVVESPPGTFTVELPGGNSGFFRVSMGLK